MWVAAVCLCAPAAIASPSSVPPEAGYELGEIQSPRVLALGGALNAVGTSTSALYLNPANLPFSRVYHFEGVASFSPEARRQSYGGAVVDSSTSKITGGFAGTWSNMDPDGINRTWTDLRLALAYPLGDKLALGATGRYLRVNQSVGTGPFGQTSLASDGTSSSPILNTFTFDAGLTAAPVDSLRIGVVGHNLTGISNGLAPTTLAGGVGYTHNDIVLEADGLADFSTWGKTRPRIMAGGEIFLADHFPIRLGYRYDAGLNTHAISAGLGYISKKWSFEISGRHDIVGKDPNTMLSAGLRYFYDATTTQSNQTDAPDPF
jgi:opacity protein-like surface antigen